MRATHLRLPLLLAFVLCVAAFAGCGGGSSQNDGDTSVDGDTAIDGDTESDPECACSGVSVCCDGCNPAAAGTMCDDGNACTTGEVCDGAGGCAAGTPVACPDTPCRSGGSCDPASGDCRFDTLLADGGICEAEAGAAASGVCRDGRCDPVGACNHRASGLGANLPCNLDVECASGLCVHETEWKSYCTLACDGGTACPAGMGCSYDLPGAGRVCAPRDATLPGDGSLPLFAPCNGNEDCEGALCLSYRGNKFCTLDCAAAGCGDCGTCEDGGIDLGFPFDSYCRPAGSIDETGSGCGYDFDCESRHCLNHYCTEKCVDFGGRDSCPDGFTCRTDAWADGIPVCVDDRDLGRGFGEPCSGDWQCAAGSCGTISGRRICLADCTAQACVQGACVETGRSSFDSKLGLYRSGVATPVKEDDDSGEGNFSKIEWTVDEAGDFLAMVTGYSGTTSGWYLLTVSDGSGDPAQAVEVEPNDGWSQGMPLSAPVRVTAFLAPGERDLFAFPAAAGTALSIETGPATVRTCVPDDLVGATGYGGACEKTYQCEGGRTCRSGYCTGTCTLDTDCPDGICFGPEGGERWCVPGRLVGSAGPGEACPNGYECANECFSDPVFNGEAYCTAACEDDADCPGGMGCWRGACVRGVDGGQFPYSACRVNADCDTGQCVDGVCSAACGSDGECEGGAPIEPVEFGVCWPCDPANGNADCNPGGTGPNMCVTANQIDFFCGTDCTFDPSGCPSGTRCYVVGWFGEAVCAPVTLGCDGGARCSGSGYCLVPRRSEGQACRESAECTGGRCENGICQGEGCSADADCGCPQLACDPAGWCAPDEAGMTVESEPDDLPAEALPLYEPRTTVSGMLEPQGGLADVDLYRVRLDVGQALDVRTLPFCGHAADTRLRLLDGSGVPLDGWENDDVSQSDITSALAGFVAGEAIDVLIEVTQSPLIVNLERNRYLLEVAAYEVADNDTCAGAPELLPGSHQLSLDGGLDSYAASGCTGYPAPGPDLAWTVKVPHHHVVTASLTSPFDGQIYLVRDCADTASSCVAGADAELAGGSERVAYDNESGGIEILYLIVDSFPPLSDRSFTLELGVKEVVQPENDTAPGALPLDLAGGPVDGTSYGAADDYNPGADGCAGADASGPDVVYAFELAAGRFARISATARFAPLLYVTADPADPSACLAGGRGIVTVSLPEAGREVPPLYLVVDSGSFEARGDFTLVPLTGEIGDCSGPCDPATAGRTCTPEGGALCLCDTASRLYVRTECAPFCIGEGGVDGICVTIDYQGGATGCLCEHDCGQPDNVAAQCSGLQYTNCTCAAVDPCAWVGDSQCDDFCAAAWPDDHLDDAADCGGR